MQTGIAAENYNQQPIILDHFYRIIICLILYSGVNFLVFAEDIQWKVVLI